VCATGQTVTVVHKHHQANGEWRFVEIIAAPMWESDGTFQGIVESMRDVTKRLRAEEALQHYAERLRALSARLAEVAEAERQRLAQELHDQVGQRLTALGINLNIIQTQVPEEMDAIVPLMIAVPGAADNQTHPRRDDLRPSVLTIMVGPPLVRTVRKADWHRRR
jgi:signal transduction histidine kinase